MGIAKELIINKHLEASADAGCLKIKRSVDVPGLKYDCGPVDAYFVIFIADRLENILVTYRLFFSCRILCKPFRIIVDKILGKSEAFCLSCRRTVYKRPV